MDTRRVNEETLDGNYVIELLDPVSSKWKYVLTEFSVSVAIQVAVNLNNASGQYCRVLSRRSKNIVLSEIK